MSRVDVLYRSYKNYPAVVQFVHTVLFTEWALRPIQSTSCDVRLSVCVSVCLCHRETPSSGGPGDFWLNRILLIFGFR